MGKILCSTRGGEASIRTQEAAIARAKETGDELIFFYVSDVEFLAKANYALRSDVVVQEMDNMADFLLTMAVERAQKADQKAHYIIKHGDFLEQLIQTMEEEAITLVVLGRPAEEGSAFKIDALQNFATTIEQKTGVKVWVASDDSQRPGAGDQGVGVSS